MRSLILFATLSSAAAVSAQKTWIVDIYNGPGSDFTEIQAAIDAAKSGDIIQIKTGAYEGFTLAKGLRIFANPDVVVHTGSAIFGKPVVIRGVPRGEVAVLRDFTIDDPRAVGRSVQIDANKGTVQFESMRILVPSTGTPAEAVTIKDSAGVSFQQCEVISGMDVRGSNVMVTEASLRRIRNAAHLLASRPAITAADSRITLAQCFLKGQDGVTPYNAAQPGLLAIRSTVRVTGLAHSAIRAGIEPNKRVPALQGDPASTLVLDPRPTLLPSGGASGHEGFGTVVSRNLTFLSVHGGRVGSTMILAQHGTSGEFYSLSVSLPTEPFPWQPFGYVWLDQSVRILLLAGVYDSTALVQLRFQVPPDIRLRGLPLGWHAVSGRWPDIRY